MEKSTLAKGIQKEKADAMTNLNKKLHGFDKVNEFLDWLLIDNAYEFNGLFNYSSLSIKSINEGWAPSRAIINIGINLIPNGRIEIHTYYTDYQKEQIVTTVYLFGFEHVWRNHRRIQIICEQVDSEQLRNIKYEIKEGFYIEPETGKIITLGLPPDTSIPFLISELLIDDIEHVELFPKGRQRVY